MGIRTFCQVSLQVVGRFLLVLIVGLVTVTSASAQITVTGALLEERTAAPGEKYQGAITIRNTSDTPQTATLSLVDYRFDASGANSFDPAGSQGRSSTGWITLSKQSVSVPPQATQVVGYTVTVPSAGSGSGSGATPPFGTFWSAVLVETEDRSVPVDVTQFTVTPKLRYAVQLVTHVGQSGECRLAFSNPRVQTGAVAVDVAGEGTRACRPSLKLEVYNSEGTLRHMTTLRGSYLYPATSARQTFDLAPLAPGAYSFLVLADVGAEKLQGARFQVTVR